jgi:hypothetical protein
MNLVKLLYLKCIKWWNDYMNRAVSRGIAGMGAYLPNMEQPSRDRMVWQDEPLVADSVKHLGLSIQDFNKRHVFISPSACYDPSLQTSASAAILVRPGANVTIIKR